MSLVDKVNNLHDFIAENIHISDKDFKIKSRTYNTEVLFGVLNSLLENKIIYVGEYGLGKSSLSSTISSLAYQIPIQSVTSASIKGNPELSSEYVVGRPDLGELNQGNEKVIWSKFLITQPKIVDELNRIPASKQSLLLSGMQEGSWSHLNQTFVVPSGSWFATMNYPDAGTKPVGPALMDRFDLMVEAKSPSMNVKRLIRNQGSLSLAMPSLARSYDTIIENTQDDLVQLYTQIQGVKSMYRDTVKKSFGLTLIDDEERQTLKEHVSNVEYEEEAHLFFDFISSEFDSCQVFGQKRSYEECPQGCHYKNYPCYDIGSGMSIRTDKAIMSFSKALAFLDGQNVQPYHIKKVFPLAMWHKTKVREEELEKVRYKERGDPERLAYFKSAMNASSNRFGRLKKKQKKFVEHILNGDTAKVEAIQSKLDHPVFKEYLK